MARAKLNVILGLQMCITLIKSKKISVPDEFRDFGRKWLRIIVVQPLGNASPFKEGDHQTEDREEVVCSHRSKFSKGQL